jgi:hypothetical protein
MPEEFKCEVCGGAFGNAIAVQQHKLDRHGIGDARQMKKEHEPTSHELKEQRRKEAEAARMAQESATKKAKDMKRTAIYGGIAIAIVGIIVVAMSLPKTPTDNTRPQLGPLGGIHTHQDFKMYMNGQPVDFSQAKYQLRAQHVHFEGGDGDVTHVHATGVTLGYALETLGMKLTNECLTPDTGGPLCNTDSSTLKLYVNGRPNTEFGGYLMRDLDKILLSYGNETEEQLQVQLDSISDKARVESARAATETGLPSHVQNI